MAPVVFVNRFLVPKEGSSESECEDAIGIRPDASSDEAVAYPLSAAVSDGASESLLATRWSRLLVEHAAEVGALHPEVFDDPGTLSAELVRRAVEPWDDQIREYCSRRQTEGRPVQWYEQPGLEKGAFATLVALRLYPLPFADPDDGGPKLYGPAEWEFHAVALGDSCLFHVSCGEVRAFPIASSAEFGLNPLLLGSRNHDVDLIASRLAHTCGHLRDGDELLLTTDALAAWFLRGCEEQSHPWHELGDAADKGQEEFGSWVREQRAARLMRNDDVALVRILARTERNR
ncbi:hypothetical protein RKE29_25010 [Streptomyces sp. B1866]|uniref:hypothetical protein n=1 Tax=Streptomyces sp. B1866 TaxID=3075431 RepID=UPI00288E208E|nr:hypothetical protein [Streptomyces sp. B1866]MDT3399857.1 hypothetical protein [Streptomyces sp. B1866]